MSTTLLRDTEDLENLPDGPFWQVQLCEARSTLRSIAVELEGGNLSRADWARCLVVADDLSRLTSGWRSQELSARLTAEEQATLVDVLDLMTSILQRVRPRGWHD